MKNFSKLLGIIALIAVIGFSMASCKEDDTTDDSGTKVPATEVPATEGKLTITGIPAEYNGNYIAAECFNDMEDDDFLYLVAAADIDSSQETFTGAKISGGSAELKVWKIDDEGEAVSYNGSDKDLECDVAIFAAKNPDEEDFIAVIDSCTVDFTNGVGTYEAGVFVPYAP